MADFIFKISPNIVLGSYTSNRLGQYASEWGSKFLIVLDPVLKENDSITKITDSLKEKNVDYFIFEEIPVGSDTETAKTVLKLAQNAKIHGVIAIGGERTIAIARIVCALYYETEKTIYDYIDNNLVSPKKMLPLICLPSTNRDNAIFTDRIFITDARSTKAKIIKVQNGLCKLVLWDPNLQMTLTEKQTYCMSLEILAFAVEGYLSQKATFFSDMIIEKSVQLLNYAIDGTPSLSVTTPQEVLLAEAGCMASLGAASSSFGALNLLSATINARYKISSSLISAILLPYIIEDASTFKAEKLATLARILHAAQPESSTADAVASFADFVRQKIAKINIPARLKELSLSIEQLSLATEDAGELELINTLQRSMTTDDLFEIVKKAY